MLVVGVTPSLGLGGLALLPLVCGFVSRIAGSVAVCVKKGDNWLCSRNKKGSIVLVLIVF